MQQPTPFNSPERERRHFWQDQVAYLGLLLWHMRHDPDVTRDHPAPASPPVTLPTALPERTLPTPSVGSLLNYPPTVCDHDHRRYGPRYG